MKRMVWMLGVLAALGVTASGQNQAPSFSGVWAATKDAPAALPAAPSAILGQRFELKHAGSRLAVIRPVRDFAIVTDLALDGSETRTRVPGAMCLGDAAVVNAATFDGRAITFRTTASIPQGGGPPTPLAITLILRTTSPDTLEVEGTMRVSGDPAPRQVATVYRRSTEPMPNLPAAPAVKLAPARLADVAWIAGTWTGGEGTSAFEERWSPASGGSMLATSRTLRAGAVTAFEFLCIAERSGSLVYTAMPNGRTPATDFMLTAIDPTSATFENPLHDFPKKIRYVKRADGALEATISGDAKQRATTFVFKRQ